MNPTDRFYVYMCVCVSNITLVKIFQLFFFFLIRALHSPTEPVFPRQKDGRTALWTAGITRRQECLQACLGSQDEAHFSPESPKGFYNLHEFPHGTGYGNTDFRMFTVLTFSSVATGGESVRPSGSQQEQEAGSRREFSIRLRSLQCPRSPELKVSLEMH